MPRWDFSCDACGTVREISFPRYEDSKHATCETCGEPLTRLPSRSGFVLRGGGWYSDGYSKTDKN